MPWSALGEPRHGQPTPPHQAVFGQRLDRILAARGNEATRRRSQWRDDVPVQLDHRDEPTHGRRAHGMDDAHRRAHRSRPTESSARRNPRRNSCSNRADDAARLPGSARMTIWSESWRSPNTDRATCRSRRDTRWRSTAEPTDLPTISPTRGPVAASRSLPRRTWTMTSGCAARMPCFTVASKSVDRLMRLRAGSTAEKPDVAIRQIARGAPYGAGSTQSSVRRGYACATGSRARGLGAGCSAGRSACPWPRRSPRCVSHFHPAGQTVSLKFVCGRSEVILLLAGAVPRQTWVAAASPTFGRLFEGTDRASPGQTWPAPRHPLDRGRRHRHRRPPSGRPPTGVEPNQAHRTLNNPIGMQQNGWQPHGKLLASASVVLDCNDARQRSEDGGSTSCLTAFNGFLPARRSRAVAGRLWLAYAHPVHTCV